MKTPRFSAPHNEGGGGETDCPRVGIKCSAVLLTAHKSLHSHRSNQNHPAALREQKPAEEIHVDPSLSEGSGCRRMPVQFRFQFRRLRRGAPAP